MAYVIKCKLKLCVMCGQATSTIQTENGLSAKLTTE